ncbi:MAG: EamA family transporter, partial [Ilumatobacteraceae bacterium]
TAPLLAIRPLDVFETRTGVLVLCHLSLAALAIAYMAFGRGLRRLPPTSVTLLTIAEPLVATVLAVSVLDEQLSGVGWFGAVVLMSGLVAVATTTDETNATVRP